MILQTYTYLCLVINHPFYKALRETIYTVIKIRIYQQEYSFTSVYQYFLSSIIQNFSSESKNIKVGLGSIKTYICSWA